MRYTFKDKSGKPKILVETSIPGFVLVPDGSHPSEIVHLDEKEFDKTVTKIRSTPILKEQTKA